MRAPDDGRLSKALAILDLPPTGQEGWADLIQIWLDDLAKNHDELGFKRDGPRLTRYIKALRELRASRNALGQRFFLPLCDIDLQTREAQIMLNWCNRSRGQPANKRTRMAVETARFVLEVCGFELTTERKGKWHLLSQIFADTGRDLRHHLTTVLAEKSK